MGKRLRRFLKWMFGDFWDFGFQWIKYKNKKIPLQTGSVNQSIFKPIIGGIPTMKHKKFALKRGN